VSCHGKKRPAAQVTIHRVWNRFGRGRRQKDVGFSLRVSALNRSRLVRTSRALTRGAQARMTASTVGGGPNREVSLDYLSHGAGRLTRGMRLAAGRTCPLVIENLSRPVSRKSAARWRTLGPKRAVERESPFV
jgi:hypothetical protein